MIRSESELEPFESIIRNPIFRSEKNALSFQARFHYYNTYSLYYRVKNDHGNLFLWRKNLLEQIEQFPHLCESGAETYFVAVNNLVFACINIGKYKEALEYLKKMESIKAPTEDLKILIFSSKRNLELAALFHMGEFEQGIKKLEKNPAPELENKMANNQKMPYFYYNALLYFAVENYKRSLFWLNKILDDKESGFRQDIHNFARILNLIVHFELDHKEQLEYYVKSTYKYFSSRSRLFQSEAILLQFIKEAARAKDKGEVYQLFVKLKKDILNLNEDKYERKILDYMDFITWLDSKIEKKSFAEIKRNKKINLQEQNN